MLTRHYLILASIVASVLLNLSIAQTVGALVASRGGGGGGRKGNKGRPSHFGDGCPPQSVEFIPASDGETVSVLFSAFNVQTQGNKTRERKICTINIDFDIDNGTSIGVAQIDLRGNVYVPNQKGSLAQLSSYFVPQGRSKRQRIVQRMYQPNTDTNILESVNVAPVVWSSCGGKSTVTIETELIAKKKKGQHEDVQIMVDSADIQKQQRKGLRYVVLTRDC